MDQTTFTRSVSRRLPRLPIIALVAVIAALALAPASWGQTATRGYAGQAGNTLAQVSGPGQPPAAEASADSSGSLAFTGLDVGLMAGGGLLLLGCCARSVSEHALNRSHPFVTRS